MEELRAQRVLAQAQGYEDPNDHGRLRDAPLLALAAGKRDLTGAARDDPAPSPPEAAEGGGSERAGGGASDAE